MNTSTLTDTRVHNGTFFNRYKKVNDDLQKGGFGKVYRITSQSSPELALLCKEVPKASFVQQEVISQIRMAKATAPIHDVVEDQDTVYMVMEPAEKDLLRAHLDIYESMAEYEVQHIIAQALKILARAHAQGLVHLDVKPANFVYASPARDRILAIDWGLSVPCDPDSELANRDPGNFSGTPTFMAPEQLRSEASPKSDVWAVGILACQLLTGKVPFTDRRNPYSPSLAAVWRAILLDELDTTRPEWKHASEEAKAFCQFLLQKDPKIRPTALEALSHPWLAKAHAKKVYTIKELNAARKERLAWIGTVMASAYEALADTLQTSAIILSSTPGQELRHEQATMDAVASIFNKLDTDCDGAITFEDLVHHLKLSSRLNKWELEAEKQKFAYHTQNKKCLALADFEELILSEPKLSAKIFT